MQTLFSSKALKAWVAGLSVGISAYIIPALAQWLSTITPEGLVDWFAGYGLSVEYGASTLVVGAIGVIATYLVKNK